MSARLLDGTRIAAAIRAEAAAGVRALAAEGVRPCLAVVLAGDNSASALYVRGKVKACEELGIRSERIFPAANIGTEDLLAIVARLNRDAAIDGILVQLPLPRQVDAKQVLLAIDPAKDVDGFHPLNMGNLVANRPGLIPCTPAGVIEMLERCGIPIAGREAVVVGRSDIVGKPMALLLLHRDATVTVAHSHTRDLAAVCRRADILVAAIGRPALLDRDYIKPGAVVIDVGQNRLTTREEVERCWPGDSEKQADLERRGCVLVGDVHPGAARELASAFTPVPGGVGPLTIAMLMANTVQAARARHAVSQPLAAG